ncbi:MAG: hypothetical protein OXC94_08730 [Chloroflexi bacterium]|nr:hypothetical protein [Chloroflexota bacterium]
MTTPPDRGPHEGRWRILPNLAADSPGIHSDGVARGLGFRAGPVLGETVAQAAIPAVVAAYGESWFEGGWVDLKIVSPVYEDEEVRERAAPGAGGDLEIAIETRAGRLAVSGRAGLGARDPWDAGLDGTRGPEGVLPGVRLGAFVAEAARTVTAADVAVLCDAAGDGTPWFRGPTRWGGPIAPPIALLLHAHDIQVEIPPGPGVIPQAMGSDYQVVVERPVALEEPVRVRTRWADKGVSGRCWFRTIEFSTESPDGRALARGRQRVKWFIEPAGGGR